MTSRKQCFLTFALVLAHLFPVAQAETSYVAPPYTLYGNNGGPQWLGVFQDYEKATEAGEEWLRTFWWMIDCNVERQESFNGFSYSDYPPAVITEIRYTISLSQTGTNPQCGNFPGYQAFFSVQGPISAYSVGENLGQRACDANNYCGNPINVATRNKYQEQADIDDSSLKFSRHYNSRKEARTDILGSHWTHTYSRRVSHVGPNSPAGATLVYHSDGGFSTFRPASPTGWTNDATKGDVLDELKLPDGSTAGWRYISQGSREIEQYDSHGRLVNIANTASNSSADIFYASDNPEDETFLRIAFVENQNGRTLGFQYNESGNLGRLVSSDGAYYDYQYDSSNRLTGVTYPGGQSKHYAYAEVDHSPNGAISDLTGIFDEQSIRYATFDYDGDPISTQHAGGVEKFSVQYNSADSISITTPLGGLLGRTFTTLFGVKKATSVTETCQGCNPRTSNYSYDGDGHIDLVTDPRGLTTDFDYNPRGLLAQKIDAANDTTGKKRTIQTDWHASFNVPVERRVYDSGTSLPGVLKSRSTWTYNSRGQALTSLQIDPATSVTRTATTTYCEQADVDAGTCPLLGLARSIDGPRTDVSDITTYTYYPSDDASCITQPTTCPHRKGDLWKVTNALGQVTETLKYDGAGRVLSVKDVNGVITDLEYHPRGWLAARKVRSTDGATETDDAITRIEYWPIGTVKKVTQPDGAYTAYTYDIAHRLTDIVDNDGNSIHYTLDNAGNRIAESTKDDTGTLLRSLSRVCDQLGQLQTLADAYSNPTDFSYDANGNTDTVTDALNRVAENDYDPLNRLAKTIQDVDGIDATTQFQYDARDNLTQVTDPKGLNTGYQYNGLNDLTQLTSPDTGTTTYTYDSGGNRKTQTDARGITATYSYDVLDRLTGISYPNSVHNITYTYDTTQAACITGETFTKGRLTKMLDGSGSTQYCYDRFGHLVRKVQTTNTKVFTVRYAYTKAGRLNSVIYPDGTTVDYVRDGQGRITEVGSTRSGSTRQVLLSQATYYPFGPVAEWVYGNGRLMQRSLNQNYQPGLVEDGFPTGISIGYEFDAVGNLVKVRNADQSDPPRRLFGYDTLNRLTETKDGTTLAVLQAYGYDETGNRLSITTGATTTYTYPTTSHRLSQVGAVARTHDNAGNTTAIGGTAKEFLYNDTGRMSRVSANGTPSQYYRYNARGERVHKYINTTHFYTVYDEAGHWLGDYNGNGTAIQQAIWLDDLPVGLLIDAGVNQKLHYVEADALGSPRVVIDPVRDVAVWNWDIAGEAFGNTAPNQDPDGDGTNLIFHMRFPGQRYDAASGLNYNYLRDGYESQTGRYSQSDPIGLAGGMSTYAYVNGNPLVWIDPEGLDGIRIDPNAMRAQGARDAEAMNAMGAAFSILSGYAAEMKRKNIPFVDQFYHCLGACRATQATGNRQMVLSMMESKESIDFWRNRLGLYRNKKVPDDEMLADMAGDMAVNQYGAGCGPNEDCVKRCRHYLDLIPTARRPEMSVYRPEWRPKP